MTRTELLPAVLDTAAAAPLADMVRDRLAENEPLHLDGSSVVQLGQACLQVLLSARDAATRRNLTFAVCDPSDALKTMATLAGGEALFANSEG